jgi:hypothetical protein
VDELLAGPMVHTILALRIDNAVLDIGQSGCASCETDKMGGTRDSDSSHI